jgi:hypothetical protein
MSWRSIVDAWVTELVSNVPELAPPTIVHRYAPWSVENLALQANERHLAIWPTSEPEVVVGYVASPPSDLATQTFAVLVWEDASAESTRAQDDDAANLAWLELHEAIRYRLYLLANLHLGDAEIMDTHYAGAGFDMGAGVRSMVLTFRVRVPIAYV